MKPLIFVCALLLFAAVASLPIGYFTFLRIIVSIGALCVIVVEAKKKSMSWVVAFVIVAVLFNPLIPVYLHSKSAWMPIDIACGVLFIVKGLT